MGLVGLLLMAGLIAHALWRVRNRTLIEFRICQNTDLILFSDFGEPPQFAMWLEDPENNRLKTVFVTHRSATGDWEGKAECPAALPRWFEIYRKEAGHPGLPTLESPAPDAVTGATPKSENFAWAVEVEPGSRWICWIEVNIAADYNEAFQEYDEAAQRMDTHQDGQPSLVYRGEIMADVGASVVPERYGYTAPDTNAGEVRQDLDVITTAAEVFRAVEISVVRPRITLF